MHMPGSSALSGTNVQLLGSGQRPPAVPPRCGQLRCQRPPPEQTDSGRQLDAQERARPSSRRQESPELQAKPPVGLEPTTLPYHGRVGVLQAFTDAHKRARNPCNPKNPACTGIALGIRPLWIWRTENGRKVGFVAAARGAVDRQLAPPVGSPTARADSRIARTRQCGLALPLLVRSRRQARPLRLVWHLHRCALGAAAARWVLPAWV
jgi:hypothetical protein